jgi:hypothetical protein
MEEHSLRELENKVLRKERERRRKREKQDWRVH